MTKKTDKELEREKIAEDIKKYLAKGGAVKKYDHGESTVFDPLFLKNKCKSNP